MAVLEFRLLGSVEVVADGVPVPLGPAKRRAVLAALAVDAGRPVPVDTLIDRVWGEAPSPEVRNTLYSHVARLRRLLADAAGAGRASHLVRRSGSYVLDVDPDRVDLLRVRRLLEAAREAADPERVALLQEALALWRGDALADVPGVWAERTRDTVEEQRLAALVAWANLELAAGNADAVLGAVIDAMARHPLSEPLIAVRLRALLRTGRAAEALSGYAAARRRLVEELGTEPGPELQTVYDSLLRGDMPRMRPSGGEPVASGTRPRQLPADVREFTGRESELRLLDDVLVTLDDQVAAVVVSAVSGTAGVGKTALAVRWAHRVVERFPDGQLYLDLRGFGPDEPLSPGEGLAVLLRALGVDSRAMPAQPEERAAMYRTLLADRRVLVVLDNAANVEQVRLLIPGGPSCIALVTSRDSMSGLVARDGAHRIELDVLPDEDGIALMSTLVGSRARADLDATRQVARLCAGLPLALRIVAERLSARPEMTVAELARELGDERRRLDVLDAVDDIRTAVRSVFSWSYRHLDPIAARAFRLLGLVPGTDLDAFAASALLDIDVALARDIIVTLARAHLVSEHRPGRFRMHDLLRAYARERADEEAPEEGRSALDRLRAHYLSVSIAAMNIRFPQGSASRPAPPPGARPGPPFTGPADARAWLDANRINLVASARHAAEHGSGHYAATLLRVVVRFLEAEGHYTDAYDLGQRVIAAAVADGRHEDEMRTSHWLAVVHARQGQFDRAIPLAGRALEISQELGHPRFIAASLNILGAFHTETRQAPEAREYLTRALAICTELNDSEGMATIQSNLVELLQVEGRFEESIGYAEQALETFTKLGDTPGVGRTLASLGETYRSLGRYEEALECHRRSLAALHDSGVRNLEVRGGYEIAAVYLRMGRHEEAISHGLRALDDLRSLQDKQGEAQALEVLGAAYLGAGQHDVAQQHLSRALDLAIEVHDRLVAARVLNGLASALLTVGRSPEALTHYRTALAVARAVGNRQAEAMALDGIARVARAEGRTDDARTRWRESLQIYATLRVPEADMVRQELGVLDGAGMSVAEPADADRQSGTRR